MSSSSLKTKWKHFEYATMLENYIFARNDFALIGPSKSGKTEIVRDMTSKYKHVFVISCLRNIDLKTLEKAVAMKLYHLFKPEGKLANPNFNTIMEILFEMNDRKFPTHRLIFIFENVENILMSKNNKFYSFYELYEDFVKDVQELTSEITFQTIVVSRMDVCLELFKFPMIFPSSTDLEGFIIKRFEHYIKTVKCEMLRKRIENERSSFSMQVLSFDVVRRDFEIYDILVNILFRKMVEGFSRARKIQDEYFELAYLPDFRNSMLLLNINIENAYLSKEEFDSKVETLMDTKNDQIERMKKENELENRNQDLEKTLSIIPETAGILLIAFYIEDTYDSSFVENILDKVKVSNKRTKVGQTYGGSKKTGVNKKTKTVKKKIEMNRVLETSRRLMKNINNFLLTPEKDVTYCSLRMAINFDFLIARGWIRKISEKNSKIFYNFTCDEKTIKILIEQRFIVLGEEILKVSDN